MLWGLTNSDSVRESLDMQATKQKLLIVIIFCYLKQIITNNDCMSAGQGFHLNLYLSAKKQNSQPTMEQFVGTFLTLAVMGSDQSDQRVI